MCSCGQHTAARMLLCTKTVDCKVQQGAHVVLQRRHFLCRLISSAASGLLSLSVTTTESNTTEVSLAANPCVMVVVLVLMLGSRLGSEVGDVHLG